MTIPFFVEDPNTFKQVQVPQDIVYYCDNTNNYVDREDLKYIDCVWMHMGYYGTPADIMERFRNKHFNRTDIYPVFE
jgi:hypothetical protein